MSVDLMWSTEPHTEAQRDAAATIADAADVARKACSSWAPRWAIHNVDKAGGMIVIDGPDAVKAEVYAWTRELAAAIITHSSYSAWWVNASWPVRMN